MTETPFFIRLERLLSLTEGRDKAVKAIQYSSRFLLYEITKQSPKSPYVELLTTLISTLSSARRVFRLCRWVGDVNAYRSTLKDIETKTGSQAIISVVVTTIDFASNICDDVDFSGSYNLLPGWIGEKASFWSDVFWTSSLVFGIVQALRDLVSNLNKPAAVIHANSLVLIKLLCDMVVASTKAFDLRTNKGMFALCGVMSSALSLRKLWLKTNVSH